jgi:hypothetical protein
MLNINAENKHPPTTVIGPIIIALSNNALTVKNLLRQVMANPTVLGRDGAINLEYTKTESKAIKGINRLKITLRRFHDFKQITTPKKAPKQRIISAFKPIANAARIAEPAAKAANRTPECRKDMANKRSAHTKKAKEGRFGIE